MKDPSSGRPGEQSLPADRNLKKSLAGTLTHENLKAAFATDAQAGRLYAYFARTAEIEGHPEAARTLEETAESQAFFADGNVDLLRQVGDPMTDLQIGETDSNLRSIIEAAGHESNLRLPEMARTALAEGFPDVASWFESLAKAKKAHALRFENALKHLETDAD